MNDSRLHYSQMPAEYAAKMRAARKERAMRGERRVITMLFCDVVGSTAMAGQLDPEEWAEIMNEAFEYLITPIYRYEGTIARLLGDAILAFFGAPIAHEDDPQRAILAGLAIVEGTKSFATEIAQDYGFDFNVRVGINTGPVVVGDVGNDLALEYTAMGDAINLASRMESTAEPGTVQVTAATYALVAPLFLAEDVGQITVKGKADPVQAYQILGHRAQPQSLRGFGGLQTPLVGRNPELDTLKQLVRELQHGHGQIVTLTGDAGLGKSRLIEELRIAFSTEIAAAEIGWIEGRGISYDTTRAYGVIMQMFRQFSSVARGDTAQVAREKIRARVNSFRPEVRETMIPAFEILLVIEDGLNQPGQEGEALKRELFASFLATWRETVNVLPMVAVFDDLHWADSASIELLTHIFQLVESTPSLIICSYRPYAQAPSGQIEEAAASRYAANYTEITLQPLPAVEGTQLVNHLMAAGELPPTLYEKILTKTDGNPFFIEEVVRALIDSDVLVQDGGGLTLRSAWDIDQIEIPDNVLSLLVSRIDRLEKESKQTLQLASVIGRSFQRSVLETISEQSAPLDSQLAKLQEMGLLIKDSGLSEESYLFRHALTRDAAYNSILHRQRRRYHRRVAEAMEQLFAQNLAEEAHRLAFHYYEARNFERALHFYTKAGDRAARLYANAEAVDQYGRALEIAQAQGTRDRLIYLYKARGRALEVSGRYEDAMANYQALETAARVREDEDMRLEALLATITLRTTYTDQYDPEQGRLLLQEALVLAKSCDDRPAQAKIYWNLMLQGSNLQEKPHEVVAYGEKAVAIAREEDLREELAFALNDLARPYSQIGEMDKAAAVLEESGHLWRELDNKPMLADNLGTLASGYRYQGRLHEAQEMAQEALQISRSIGNFWGEAYSLNVLGPIFMELGLVGMALDAWHRALPIALKANFIGAQAFTRTDMALAYGYLGDTAQGMALAEYALVKINEMGQTDLAYYPKLVQARLQLIDRNVDFAARVLAEPVQDVMQLRTNLVTAGLFITVETLVGIAAGKYQEILLQLDEAIARNELMGLTLVLIELWQLKAKVLLGLDRAQEATAVLNKARANAESVGSRKQLWQILAALYEIQVQQGDMTHAKDLQQEVRAEIDYIAGQISDPDLKRLFLNQIPGT